MSHRRRSEPETMPRLWTRSTEHARMATEFVRHLSLAHSLTNDLLSRRGNLITNGLGGVAEQLGSLA